MKKIIISLMFLSVLSPAFAFAQTVDTPVTIAQLQTQLQTLKDELVALLTQQLNELRAQLAVLQAQADSTTQSVSTLQTSTQNLGSVSTSTNQSIACIVTNPQDLSEMSSDPSGCDAAVTALRLEVENVNALHTMCANTKNRAVNKTVNRLCVENGI